MRSHRPSVLPLVVGVTGKRDLRGHDEAVRDTLRTIFDRLDAHCPRSDKILLTGLAEGADTLAAEEALRRPGWRVIAALPLAAEVYLQDFEAAAAAHLKALLADPRVHPLPLKPLLHPKTGRALDVEALARTEGATNEARNEHYEQLGLFIAEHCGLLIAIKNLDETPGRLGGTARVVHGRLHGRRDHPAADVVRRSQELAAAPPLGDPTVGPVWLIDLAAYEAPRAGPPFTVLMPGETDEAVPGSPSSLDPAGPSPSHEQLVRLSLADADQIEALNRRAMRLGAGAWRKVNEAAGPDTGDAGAMIQRAHQVFSGIQMSVNGRLKAGVWLLAAFFLAAITAFECYAELKPFDWSPWMSWVYLVAAIAAVAVNLFAAGRAWQPIAEDYRAIAEALRVQLAWWGAGLGGPAHRVDRFYLQGGHGSLARVRGMLSQSLNAALLTRPPARRVVGTEDHWISGQISYFRSRNASRQTALFWTEHTSWFLFAASLGSAACLALMQLSWRMPFLVVTLGPRELDPRLLLVALSASVVVALFLASVLIAPLANDEDESRTIWIKALGWLMAAVAGGFVAAGLCALATLLPDPRGGCQTAQCLADERWRLAKDMVAMAAILPVAAAGAIRFIAEKLSWSAELRGYKEAEARFRRGAEALAANPSPEARRQVITALGLDALRENEAWLRAHRERPLEPIVGG
jgi:hypothetical protein